MKKYKPIFLCIFSAALLALSFPSANLWILAWVAFIPLFFALSRKKTKDIFLLGFFTGIVFFYTAISWLNLVSVGGTIILVLCLAVYFMLFVFFGIKIVDSPFPVFIKSVFVSSVWVALEFIRSNFFTGFPWMLLGYSQASFIPVIQIADMTGVWGVSFIVMFSNTAAYELFFLAGKARHEKGLSHNLLLNFLACILLIAGVFIYGFYKLNLNPNTHALTPVKISIIQGNIPQEEKWDEELRDRILETHFSLARAAALEKPDIIIWPESSFPEDFNSEPEIAKTLFDLAREVNTYMLVGANRFDYYLYTSAFLIGPDGIIKDVYDKLHLVPFGEYNPLAGKLFKFLYAFLPAEINAVGDFSPGKNYMVFKEPADFSVLICYEDIFPYLSREFVKRGAKLLVNITNDAWYGVSGAPFQHAQASILRAVENRVPVVRAANTGFSVFIDKNGKVTASVKPFTYGHKTSNVYIENSASTTFYNRHPYLFIAISFLLSLTGFGIILLHSAYRKLVK